MFFNVFILFTQYRINNFYGGDAVKYLIGFSILGFIVFYFSYSCLFRSLNDKAE